MVNLEELIGAKEVHVQRLERDCAVEVVKRQQLLAERRTMSQTLSCQLAEGDESLHDRHLKADAVTAEMNEWRGLAIETKKKLKVTQAKMTVR